MAGRWLLIAALCLLFSNSHATKEEKQKDVKPVVKPENKSSLLGNRSRDHIRKAFGERNAEREAAIKDALQELDYIFKNAIRPVEDLYRYNDLHMHMVTESEIHAKPMVLFIGPWGVGKSTMINYMVGMEDPLHLLHTGAQPTTSEFTVVMNGERFRTMDGMVLAADKQKGFSSLEQFGQGFLEKLQGVELPYKILKKVTLVDTPGIIENRKQQERGYPFSEVTRWFVEQSDLIFVLFDPTKLDVGVELENLFQQLKGRESQIRIILNKADTISTQELMRVYGALFWSLHPLINVTEPPRVYIGSYWGQPYKPGTLSDLFRDEEVSLLNDIYEVSENRLENKVAFIRSHAIRVRIHALLVDKYLETFNSQNSIFGNPESLINDIVLHPHKYRIFQQVLARGKISKYDLPDARLYHEFFSINAVNAFKRTEYHCSMFSGCAMDKLEEAIAHSLPNLLNKFRKQDTCENNDC